MGWYAAGKGIWRMARNRAPAVGLYDALPTAGNDLRGVLGSLWGGAGVADRTVLCEKDAADTHAWNDLGRAALDARYVNADGDTVTGTVVVTGELAVADGITAPTAVAGRAYLYVDIADGDLKVRFGDNVTKTLATDT